MNETDIAILKKIKNYFSSYIIKWIIFCYNGINKNKFHKRKQPININKIDIKRIAISDED